MIGYGTGQVSAHRLPGKIMESWGELGTGSHSHALLPTPVTASPLPCSCSTMRFCRAAVPSVDVHADGQEAGSVSISLRAFSRFFE